jgi:hypothetical protein
MAKKDVVARIMENHPDNGYTEEQLKNDFTEAELKNLETTLKAGDPESKEVESGDQPEAEATVDSEGMPKEMSEEEKAANEVRQAIAEGQEIKTKYKLKNPSTQYAEEGFTLVGDEEKELPPNPSPQLIERIRAGYIVEVK